MALFNQPRLLSYLLGSWSSVTCSHVPIHWASITPNEIPIQSGHNTHKRERTGSSLLSSLVPSLDTFTENLCSKFVTYNIQTFKLKTFKHVKVHLQVQSHQLVHRSDTHCRGHIQTSGCDFVYFTILNRMEYNSAGLLVQAYAVLKKA